jgi:hypothetical protein
MKSAFLALALGLLTFGPQGGSSQAPKRPEAGKPAPLLRLNDQRGEIVELGGKRANWSVLAFFPKAATPG